MKVLQFDFGQLTIDNHIIIGEVLQDRHVEIDVVSKVIETANKYFHGKPWAYISNRKHSFSSNPMVHQVASSFEKNMLVFAVVAQRPLTQNVAEVEKQFKGKDYDFIICNSLTEAIERVKRILKAASKG
jgi:hypothetical protein